MNKIMAVGAPPTNWGTFWAYADVIVFCSATMGGVTIGYVRIRINDLSKDLKRQRRRLRKDIKLLEPLKPGPGESNDRRMSASFPRQSTPVE